MEEHNETDNTQPQHADSPVQEHHKGHDFEIVVNMVTHTIKGDTVIFDEIVRLAANLPSGPGVEYKVSFENAVKPKDGTMIPGETVKIKNGTEFVVTTTNRS